VTRDPIYKVIGAIIRAKRKKLGLKQENLASELRISRGSLANIETGRQNMLVHQLYIFAKALKLSPADLLPPAPDHHPNAARTELPLPENLKGRQKEQVARFFSQAASNQENEKEVNHDKNRTR
jgi:transcriptional regulator with XRE-family HTH domain